MGIFSSIKHYLASRRDKNIALNYFQKGVKSESINDLEEAIINYDVVINQYQYISTVSNISYARKYISLLKNNRIDKIKENQTSILNFLETQQSSDTILDLSYRFAIYLVKEGFYYDANSLVVKHLPETSQATIDIKNVISYAEYVHANNVLSEYNVNINSFNKNELSLADVQEILAKNTNFEKGINPILYDLVEKIQSNKDGINRYIIFKFLEEEKYIECFNFVINNFKYYYKEEFLFRNIANATLGIITTGELTFENYKEIISIWLSAIYNYRLFFTTLSDSTWDDNFTFTLQGILGCNAESEFDRLPENVNYDDISNSDISIAAVQQLLQNNFEKSLTDEIYSAALSSAAINFFHKEKDAIIALFSLGIDNTSICCTPYFALSNKEYFKSITSVLDDKLDNIVSSEEVLKVGILYNLPGAAYKDYSEAIILKNKAIEVVENLNQSQIQLIFTITNISRIKKFKELYSSFCNSLRIKLLEIVKQETFYESIISNYLIVCSTISDANLSYALSNFANRICVSKLNNHSITTEKGLNILFEVYKVIKDNPKINENLQEVINKAVVEVIEQNNGNLKSTLFRTLDKYPTEFEAEIIETLRSVKDYLVITEKIEGLLSFIDYFIERSSLKNSLNQLKTSARDLEVRVNLNKIAEGFSSNLITKVQAFKEIYELYRLNKNHEDLCETLVEMSNNMIEEYVMDATSSTKQVCDLLDDIRKNRSTTFLAKANKLSTRRVQILNQLPLDLRSLIETGYSNGATLTIKGMAIKNGLDYLKILSQ